MHGPTFKPFMFDSVSVQQIKATSVSEKLQAEWAQNGCTGMKLLSSVLLAFPCILVVIVLKLVTKCLNDVHQYYIAGQAGMGGR